MAARAQRKGQGMALRTAMRGALMVSRRRSSLKRIPTSTAVAVVFEAQPYSREKSRSKMTCAALGIGCKQLL
jgi:hypothetical protein